MSQHSHHEKWDVHTHTTLSPATFEALARFSRYGDFIRVRAHDTKPCCAEMVNAKGEIQREISDNAYDSAARIHECEKYGVTMQVLSPTPMMIPDYVDNASDAVSTMTNSSSAPPCRRRSPTRYSMSVQPGRSEEGLCLK